MSSMSIDNAVFGYLPHPEMKRHDGVVQVPLQTAIGFHQNILNHITDIDSFLDLLIQPHSNQLPE